MRPARWTRTPLGAVLVVLCWPAVHTRHATVPRHTTPPHPVPHHATQACVNVSPAAKAVVAAMQRFLDTSPPEMFETVDERKQFCWKKLTVRTSVHTPDVMVFVSARNDGMYV